MRPSLVAPSTLALLLAAACGDTAQPAPSAPAAAPAEPSALVAHLRARFVVQPEGVPDLPGRERPRAEPFALLKASDVLSFFRDGEHLTAKLPASNVLRPAKVRLPVKASGAFEVTDKVGGVSMRVRLLGASDATADARDGYATYRGALGGADVVHRVHAEGTEDHVHFANRPEKEELRYRVSVDAVAGLRLTSNVLELLDQAGCPRLRMTAPLALGADGEKVVPTVAVEGCAVDTSPAAPWERARVRPGASECEVVVKWQARVYPVLVDPGWVTTGSLATARAGHTASVLPDGTVLVVDGNGNGGVLASAERWSGGSGGTFSAAGTLATARHEHTASVLPDGMVLVVGGSGKGGHFASAEKWSGGAFSAAGSMYNPRFSHTASVLPDGTVLVVGGYGQLGSLASVEKWSGGGFSAAGTLTNARHQHTASVLSDGTVLVVGGYGQVGSLASAEKWSGGGFSAAGTLTNARYAHTASVLPDGTVLVVGGIGESGYVASAEEWSGDGLSAGTLVTPRFAHTASVLPDGTVLVVGGYGQSNYLASAENVVGRRVQRGGHAGHRAPSPHRERAPGRHGARCRRPRAELPRERGVVLRRNHAVRRRCLLQLRLRWSMRGVQLRENRPARRHLRPCSCRNRSRRRMRGRRRPLRREQRPLRRRGRLPEVR